MLETLWRADGGRLAEVPLRRCSAVDTSQYLHHIQYECFYKGASSDVTGSVKSHIPDPRSSGNTGK